MKLNQSELISLKDKDWIVRQKIAGDVVSQLHRDFFSMMVGRASNLTLKYIGEYADQIIRKNNCIPTFYNYKGFPSVICTSLNKELVHGFSTRDIILKEGDVLKIDIGATFEYAIADCAVTYIYGKAKDDNILKLLVSCQNALHDAIDVFKPGNRIGDIGNAIFKRSKQDGFGVITAFGGHGIDYNELHSPPFVPNKSSSQEGVVIQPGMSIAIEPMFVLNKNTNTKILNDKWTVITREIGAHYEHSITLDSDGNQHIITNHGISAKDFI